MKKLFKGFMVIACMASLSVGFALDGKTVMQNAKDIKEPKFTHALVQMDLIEKDGTTESRVVEEYGRNTNGLADMVMIFISPASVKNTRFLQKENKDRADDKWIYLPALRTTRRVASSEGSKSFMGTDATYDDMSTREIEEDTHELLAESEVKNGYTCAKVKSTPVDASSSQYKYRISWVDKETWIPVYSEMYDKKGNLVKTLQVEEITKTNGYLIPSSDILTNVSTGHATRIKMIKLEVDKAIPEKVFTSNFLNTGKI